MAAVLQPHGPMVTGLGSSLMSRRTAGNNLPGPLELPVNTLTARFGGPLSSSVLPTVLNHHQSSISALLTPPNVSGESMSPVSSVSNSAPNPSAIGIPPYTPTTGYYPTSHQYTASASPGSQSQIHGMAQSWNQPMNNNPLNNPRGRFSPSLASLMRNPTTGSPSDSLPPPSYDLGALPPFPNTIVQQGHVSPPSQQQYNMTSQAPPPPLQSPVTSQDPYMQKLPPTPGFYPSMTPQQSQFPQYNPASPPLQSPLSATTSGSRGSPPSIQVFNRPFNNSMSMQGMQSPGHMPPNYGSPSFHFNSGTAAQMSHMYGPQQGQPPMDRPFKCDQCPQSFNRNHDLKRHKRIHLAVKPFPCKFCDKSFSRKDALKVYLYSLVFLIVAN